ncbi:MAG: hypothetical protein ACYC6F_08450 [Longimicrobiales bacterium]
MLGASAPGVPTGFVEGSVGLGPLGQTHLRAQWGILRESPFFDNHPDNDQLLLSAFFADWTPAGASGLRVGASYTYRDPLDAGFTLPMLVRAFSTTSAQDALRLAGDGIAAVHVAWISSLLGVWGTWGRGDYWLNTEDFLTEPDYSQIWTGGLAVDWPQAGSGWRLVSEMASVTGSTTYRNNPTAYRHNVATQGYTHRGQMLGASIGPGAQGAWLLLERTDSSRTLGVEVERIVRDLDLYNTVFARRDGTSGEDREWRFGLLYEGPIPRFDVPGVSVKANGGLSLRWNRDYIQYSSNAHLVGPRESQIFLDLALTWDPNWKKDAPPPPPVL